jgi:hypothetical protein
MAPNEPHQGHRKMTRPCSIAGCTSTVLARYSPYCNKHRRALGRHGSPHMRAIKAAELKPFLRLIADSQAKNPTNEAWKILRQRWSRMVEGAHALTGRRNGSATLRAEADAASVILGVAGSTSPDVVVANAMAVAAHYTYDPRRYVGDEALMYAMANRVRRLDPGTAGKTWDHRSRLVRSVRRDVAPRVLLFLGSQLIQAFGAAGAQWWRLEEKRRPDAEIEREKLNAALATLQA